MMHSDKIVEGVGCIVAGIWSLFVKYRIIKIFSKDPERAELWHRKFDGLMLSVGIFAIIYGILILLGKGLV